MGASPRAAIGYAALTGPAVVVHQFLPASARPTSFLLIAASTIPPVVALLRRTGRADRTPWWLLLAAMSTLLVVNTMVATGLPALRMPAEFIVTVGHALLLAAALKLVARRGRSDVGGLIDASVALMGLGAVLWSGLLQPHLAARHSPLGAQIALFVSVFVLTGVLGALGRLVFTGGRRLIALHLFLIALLMALAGNTALAMTTGSMTQHRLPWVEALLLVAYLCVGGAALHPSAGALVRPGPAPADDLSGGRLVFLGAAIVASPLVGGSRQLVGLPADGLLIALGTLAVAPLVMLRIHRLATARQRAERALAHQATHDVLTGLPNRAELHTRLDAALRRDRERESPAVVVLFCDLNGFKRVNDRLGHAAGDQLLLDVAGRLRATLRAGDTLARYGGDEFVVLCEDTDQDGAAATCTDRIHAALEAPIVLDAGPVEVGASVGAALADGRTDADELIRAADARMYRAKKRRHAEVAA